MLPSLYYPLTVALLAAGFYALECSELVLSTAAFVTAVYVGFAGAVKHQVE